jgi:hypothetical protein
MLHKDALSILGLESGASKETIKSAYKAATAEVKAAARAKAWAAASEAWEAWAEAEAEARQIFAIGENLGKT